MSFPWNLGSYKYRDQLLYPSDPVRITPSAVHSFSVIGSVEDPVPTVTEVLGAKCDTISRYSEIKISSTTKYGTPYDAPVSMTVLNPLDAVYLGNNTFKSLRNSTGTVRITGTSGATYDIQVTFSVTSSHEFKYWYDQTTLSYFLNDKINSLISLSELPDIVASQVTNYTSYGPYDPVLSLYMVREDGLGSSIRNRSNWCSTYDFSGVSTWSSLHGNRRKFTAITPRHVVTANHISGITPVGTKIRFCSSIGQIIERTVVRSIRVLNSDLLVTTLDQDLPPSIYITGLMVTDWNTKLIPSIQYPYCFPIPVVCVTQDDYIGVLEWRQDMLWRRCTEGSCEKFSIEARSGDSGNPIFVLGPNNDLILLSVFFTKYGGESINSPIFRDLLISEVSLTGHTLKVLDLSAYNVT